MNDKIQSCIDWFNFKILKIRSYLAYFQTKSWHWLLNRFHLQNEKQEFTLSKGNWIRVINVKWICIQSRPYLKKYYEWIWILASSKYSEWKYFSPTSWYKSSFLRTNVYCRYKLTLLSIINNSKRCFHHTIRKVNQNRLKTNPFVNSGSLRICCH